MSDIPEDLNNLIIECQNLRFEELYEEGSSNHELTLKSQMSRILGIFNREVNNDLTHKRYIWMIYILTKSVEPTVIYYAANKQLTKTFFENVKNWFVYERLGECSFKHCRIEDPDKINYEIFSDACLVFYISDLVLKLSRKDLIQTGFYFLLDLFEIIFEGKAILPGSQDRRELFNWFLLDVVPATWSLTPPEKLFDNIEGIEDIKELHIFLKSEGEL